MSCPFWQISLLLTYVCQENKKIPGWFKVTTQPIFGAENRCKCFWMCRFVMESPTFPNVSKLQVGAPRSVCYCILQPLKGPGTEPAFFVCLKVRLIQWADRTSSCLIMLVVSCSCFFVWTTKVRHMFFCWGRMRAKKFPLYSFHSRVLVWYHRFWTIPEQRLVDRWPLPSIPYTIPQSVGHGTCFDSTMKSKCNFYFQRKIQPIDGSYLMLLVESIPCLSPSVRGDGSLG